MFMNFYTYILFSKSLNKYYVGSTQDINERIIRYKRGSGSQFTKGTRDWNLVYSETFKTRSEAQKREFNTKRRKKVEVI